MNAKEIAFILPEKPILKKILQITLAELGTAKNNEVKVDYNKIRLLFKTKLDFASMLCELEEMDLMKVIGTANNDFGMDSKGSRESLFMNLRAYMSFENSTHLIFDINKSKITKVLATEEGVSDMKNKPVILTLSKDGKLSRIVDGEEEKHIMKPGSLDYKILECLARLRSEKLSARDLALKLVIEKIGKERKTSPEKLIRDRILAIKKIITKKFIGIDPESFIPHADENNGYCLGKTIKIKTSNY